jgi:hypothetical protein
VDLLPAFACGDSAFTFAWRWSGLGPARAMRGNLFQGCFGEVAPNVPGVADLQRAGQCAADRLRVGAGAVPAHDLYARMSPQPFLQRGRQSVGQNINALTGFGVNQDGGVLLTLTQGEVVNPEHAWHPRWGQWQAQQGTQAGVSRDEHRQRRQSARTGTPGQFPHHRTGLARKPRRTALITLHYPGTCSRKVLRQPCVEQTRRRTRTRTTTCRASMGTSVTVRS